MVGVRIRVRSSYRVRAIIRVRARVGDRALVRITFRA